MDGHELGLVPLDFTDDLVKPLRYQEARLFKDGANVGGDEEDLVGQNLGGQVEAVRRLTPDLAAAAAEAAEPAVVVIGIWSQRTPGGHPGEEGLPEIRKITNSVHVPIFLS